MQLKQNLRFSYFSLEFFYRPFLADFFGHNLGVMSYINSYYNSTIIMLVGSLIVVVERIKFSSKIINWIAPNILAVYLLTENFYCIEFCKSWFYIDKGYPIVKLVAIAFAVTVMCVLVDKVRLRIMNKS